MKRFIGCVLWWPVRAFPVGETKGPPGVKLDGPDRCNDGGGAVGLFSRDGERLGTRNDLGLEAVFR